MANPNLFMFFDETGLDEKSEIVAIACVVTQNPDHLRNKIKSLKNEIRNDLRLRTIPSVKNLDTKGFHYCEDHQDIQVKVIEAISKIDFEAFIYYLRKNNNCKYFGGFKWYDKMFRQLIKDRLLKHKKAIIQIVFEQHKYPVTQQEERERELQAIVNKVIQDRRRTNPDFLPIPSLVKSAGKEEDALTIADYIAGVFKDYEAKVHLDADSITQSWQYRNYSMIKPKIRLICDFESHKFYSRRHPFYFPKS